MDGAGKMAQCLRALPTPSEDLGLGAPTWWLTTICNTNPKATDTLSGLHACGAGTHAGKKKKNPYT